MHVTSYKNELTPNGLKLRPETIKLLEENNRKDFRALETVSIVLGKTPKKQSKRNIWFLHHKENIQPREKASKLHVKVHLDR